MNDANDKVLFTIGQSVGSLAFIPFAALILSFPTGRLEHRGRTIVRITIWFVILAPLILLVDKRPPDCDDACPSSAVYVYHSPALAGVLRVIETLVPIGLCVAAVVLLVGRWRAATAPARRVLLPVYAAGGASLVVLLLTNLLVDEHVNVVLGPVFVALFGTVPLAFLLKDRVSDIGECADAVRRVGEGGSVLDPTVVSQLVGRRRKNDPLDDLTPREREVLELMAEGRSNQAICDRLFATQRAVEKHVTSIFTKLRLPADAADHRRVLAVLAYLRA